MKTNEHCRRKYLLSFKSKALWKSVKNIPWYVYSWLKAMLRPAANTEEGAPVRWKLSGSFWKHYPHCESCSCRIMLRGYFSLAVQRTPSKSQLITKRSSSLWFNISKITYVLWRTLRTIQHHKDQETQCQGGRRKTHFFF